MAAALCPPCPAVVISPGGQDGGAVAADRVSPWPKGAAQTESSLLPPSKNAFHFVIVEVIPELRPPQSPLCQNRDLQSERPFSRGRLVVSSDSFTLLNTESAGG